MRLAFTSARSKGRRVLALPVALLALSLLVGMGPSFRDLLGEGDSLRQKEDPAGAIAAYDRAREAAVSPTDTALAWSKRAIVEAYDDQAYESAMKSVEAALAVEDARPVGIVSAMQVKALCLMRDKEDYAAAAEVLDKATELEDVDWAKPNLRLMRGDCHRFSGERERAVEVYQEVADDQSARDALRGVAMLNVGLVHQYELRQADEAREAYERAVELNSGLKAEVGRHLEKLNESAGG